MHYSDNDIPSAEHFQHFTNFDAVLAFINRPKDERIETGEVLTLPDIGQPYTVQKVDVYKSKSTGRLVPYVEFEAPCAVPDCDEYFRCSKDLPELRKSPYMRRTCIDHTRQWSTPQMNAWKTADDIAKAREDRAAKAEAKPRKVVRRRGRIESHIVEMLHTYSVVEDSVELHALITLCAEALLPPEPHMRDTRRQVVTRAIHTLAREKDGPVNIVGNRVVFDFRSN